MELRKDLFKGIYKDLNNNDRVMYAFISDKRDIKRDKEGNRYREISVTGLAKYIGVDVATCRKSLDRLKEVNLIDIKKVELGRKSYNKIYFDMVNIPKQAEKTIIECLKNSKFGILTLKTIRRYTNMPMKMITAVVKLLMSKGIVEKYKDSYGLSEEFLSNM